MQSILSMVAALKRPKLLIRTARFGVDDYNRSQHLPRILKTVALPRSGPAILQLLEIEEDMNNRRLAGSADYSVARHVEVLIALMGEARLLRALTQIE